MLSGTCHCGAIRIEIPRRPAEITSCNCSICRRLGTLWAYFKFNRVKIHGHPENTESYIQGDRMLRLFRCRTCGCTTHWEPIEISPTSRMGVNVRNFAPVEIGSVRLRMVDGADTWKSTYWDPRDDA